jgi:hypothetical protein
MRLFPPLTPEARCVLDGFPSLIDKVFPLPRRFRHLLGRDVADLSRLLTASRKERSESYLGRPNHLSAYLRYFLPWNLYRLCRLLPALPLSLAEGDAVNDLGSGPLTLALALRICRPELRSLSLEFRCLDRTGTVLEAGKKLFAALCAQDGGSPWTIKSIKGEIRLNGALSPAIRGKPAALTAAVNVFNEIFWNLSPADRKGLGRLAEGSGRLLSSLTGENGAGAILVVEPGIPRSGEFIALLREALAARDRPSLAPCTHREPCPFPAAGKWCHFAFDTKDAPGELQALSAAAGLPKDRAVMSFLLAGKGTAPDATDADGTAPAAVRLISDPFSLGDGRWGRYGCGEAGLVLAAGSGKAAADAVSGTLGFYEDSGGKDPKTGATVVNISGRR